MHQRIARTLFLSVAAALSLMAFTAVAAQAENLSDGGKSALFLVENNMALSVGKTFSATQVGTGTLLVPGRVDILCQKGTTTGTFNSETDASVTSTFTECTTWQPVTVLGASHVTKVNCIVDEPVVATALALPKLHNGGSYLLLEPQREFLTLILLLGVECPLTKDNKVTGSIVAQVDNNNTVEPLLLFSHEIQKLFQTSATVGDHLKYGAFEAYIDTDAKAKITSASHVGRTLGIC